MDLNPSKYLNSAIYSIASVYDTSLVKNYKTNSRIYCSSILAILRVLWLCRIMEILNKSLPYKLFIIDKQIIC